MLAAQAPVPRGQGLAAALSHTRMAMPSSVTEANSTLVFSGNTGCVLEEGAGRPDAQGSRGISQHQRGTARRAMPPNRPRGDGVGVSHGDAHEFEGSPDGESRADAPHRGAPSVARESGAASTGTSTGNPRWARPCSRSPRSSSFASTEKAIAGRPGCRPRLRLRQRPPARDRRGTWRSSARRCRTFGPGVPSALM